MLWPFCTKASITAPPSSLLATFDLWRQHICPSSVTLPMSHYIQQKCWPEFRCCQHSYVNLNCLIEQIFVAKIPSTDISKAIKKPMWTLLNKQWPITKQYSAKRPENIYKQHSQHSYLIIARLRLASFAVETSHRGEGLGITTCAKTVAGGKQGHAPCKARGPPHVLKQWLGVSKGMLPVKPEDLHMS